MASSEPSVDKSFGSVVSVQELIKNPMLSIPHNYIVRPDEENLSSFPNTIPTIDFNLLLSNQTTNSELQKLHSTCKEWGIFQLVNHGISPPLLENLKHEIEEFYNLPLEEKMKFKVRAGEFEGYGTATRSQGKLDWGDRFYMIINPIARRKPHLLPELPSSFRNNLETYILEMQRLSMKLLEFMGEALEIEKKEIEGMFENGMQSVRMSYYPPCPQPEKVVGITPHSDPTGITILNQVNGVDGFEVKKDGVWLPVSFLSDSLIVNVGDILEILSNGLYKSIEHRATVNSDKERISVAFVNPKFDAEVGPANSLINPQNPPIFRKIGMEEYVKTFFSRKLNSKSHLKLVYI